MELWDQDWDQDSSLNNSQVWIRVKEKRGKGKFLDTPISKRHILHAVFYMLVGGNVMHNSYTESEEVKPWWTFEIKINYICQKSKKVIEGTFFYFVIYTQMEIQ